MMKEEYAKKVDEYFSQCEELRKSGKFNIDGVEMLLGDGIAAAKEVLIETIEEMIKQEMSAETNAESKKKRVLEEKDQRELRPQPNKPKGIEKAQSIA